MGEDFLRHRNDRFVRQRDARFMEQLRPDLFSVCAPDVTVNVCGIALCDILRPGSELWAPEVAASGPIRFFDGDTLAVQIEGDAADTIRREYRDGDTPVVAQVTEVESEHGLVVLKVGCGL